MTTFCLISDTHCQYGKIVIPECDILIHAGDACGHGTMTEFRSFASWFDSQEQAKHKFYIPGNHDRAVEGSLLEAKGLFVHIKLLCDEFEDAEGFRIFGTPWTPEYQGLAFQGDDTGGRKPRFRNLERHFGLIPKCDILVCHGPSYGIHDSLYQEERIGSVHLREAIKRINPLLFVCGHVHNDRGLSKIDNTFYVNASICHGIENESLHAPICLDLFQVKIPMRCQNE